MRPKSIASRSKNAVPLKGLCALLGAALLTLGCGGSVAGAGDAQTIPDGGTLESCAGATKVSGTITYDFVPATLTTSLDFAHASPKPIRNATVIVQEAATTIGGPVVTDETGAYCARYSPTGTGELQVVVLAKTMDPLIQVRDNTDQGAVWAVGKTLAPEATAMDIHLAHGWTGSGYDPAKRLAAPFAILDTLYTASRALMAVRAASLPELTAYWSPDNVPQRGTSPGQITTTHFSKGENAIYVLGKEGADTDEYDSHVLAHEWGHFFEANLSRSDTPPGSHAVGDALDPRLAFGEGYGNAIAAMVLLDPLHVDTLWSGDGSMTAFGFDAETESTTTDPNPGWWSEMSVTRFLYDVFDPVDTAGEPFDQIGLGLGPIYDVLVGPQRDTAALTTLFSFVRGLKAQVGVDAIKVDALLAHYGVGPITDEWGAGDPKAASLTLYTHVTAFPYTCTLQLSDAEGSGPNKLGQNRYFEFTGIGSSAIISTSSTKDVDIHVFQKGLLVASAESPAGDEEVVIDTQTGVKYVVSIVGCGPGSYSVDVVLATR